MRIKSLLFLITISIISLLIPIQIFAGETITVNPKELNKGNILTLTVSNVPNSDQKDYQVWIQDSSAKGTNKLIRTAFAIYIENGCQASTETPLFTPGSIEGNISCSSTSRADSYTITAKIKTEKLIPSGAKDDVPYSFNAVLIRPVDTSFIQVGVDNFTLITQQPTATFSIGNITPNPAKPADTVTIPVSNITKGGNYVALIEGTGSKSSPTSCQPPGPCSISLKLPDKLDNKAVTLTIIVQDPDGNRISKQINMILPEGTTNDIDTAHPVATNTPIPTKAPPPPPCKDKTIGTSGCASTDTAIGDLATDPEGFVKTVFTFLLSLSGGIAVLIFISAGYKYMTSQGNPEGVKAAQEMIVSAVTGLLFIIFSYVILQVIGSDILRIPGF